MEDFFWYLIDFFWDVIFFFCYFYNDYWCCVLLFDVFYVGCIGVEVDVWLFNNDLFVGYDLVFL